MENLNKKVEKIT